MGARRGCAAAYASERKILLVSDVIAIVKAKHVELSKQGSAAAFGLVLCSSSPLQHRPRVFHSYPCPKQQPERYYAPEGL